MHIALQIRSQADRRTNDPRAPLAHGIATPARPQPQAESVHTARIALHNGIILGLLAVEEEENPASEKQNQGHGKLGSKTGDGDEKQAQEHGGKQHRPARRCAQRDAVGADHVRRHRAEPQECAHLEQEDCAIERIVQLQWGTRQSKENPTDR